MKAWSFFICTFGCKVNQYESQAVREAWRALGGTELPEPGRADVALINSCAVTGKAERDARNAILGLERKAPGAMRLITGCSARLAGERFAGGAALHAVIPNHRKRILLGHPLEIFAPGRDLGPDGGGEKSARPASVAADGAAQWSARPENSAYPPFRINDFQRSRPILKVQDGCSRRCTYCIVPLMRGPGASRPPGEALDEARRLLAAGFRELIISGINLAQYGRDLSPAANFWDLAAMLDKNLAPEWAGRARLRISSLDPNQLDPRAVQTLAGGGMFCPHLHLSLQSGSPEILRRMGRGDQRLEAMLESLAALRRHWPVMGLGADVLTGFPGETEADAGATAEIMRAAGLHYAHVFPFAPRPGAPAAAFAGQIPLKEKMRRAALLRDLAAKQGLEFVHSLQGRVLNVIMDGHGGGKGVNEFYAPCEFARRPPCAGPNAREMTAAKAVAVKNGVLLMEKI